MSTKISLGEFVKQLAASLQTQHVSMPFRNEEPWHLLFYQLFKSKEVPGKPEFLERLRFDWDAPYPKSRELSDFLQALHWTASVSVSNPHYDVINLPDDVANLWRGRFGSVADEDISKFLSYAVDRAKKEFSGAKSL
ncbi:hypothetical protein MELA_02166 [Candidatus Methylomirabilis lanthanidiphila]|uniref:Uncharacterized protein n=1 Tax=Candidatus Methylomirabilis lanthanidiphila TaxID=2211376 RepID=A0A564ZKD1_9BACT|nr:hypothetical protein [Candidatus Methylomirabilis lanthanidiphila]VUZ85781.1 hypothetical protein MELA_02166 [Candidatus Methylomirabilis lanthanidiphila]